MINPAYSHPSGKVRRYLSRCTSTYSSFRVKGADISARSIDVSPAILKLAGINPAYFVPGARLFLLDPPQYEKLCRAASLSPGEAIGFYPLSRNGEQSEVILGEAEKLSNPARTILLPFDFKFSALSHELAHDLFLGGALSVKEREGFYKLAILETRRVLISAPDSKEAYFLRLVANSGRKKFKLTDIMTIYTLTNPSYDQRLFAGELFAYALEIKISRNRSMGVVPREIDDYLIQKGFARRRFLSIF
jgi:hypothetical protein